MHYELHLESEKKILHLEARLRLLSQENSLLKQCLLKDFSTKEKEGSLLNNLSLLKDPSNKENTPLENRPAPTSNPTRK